MRVRRWKKDMGEKVEARTGFVNHFGSVVAVGEK
jgi:hypothetical protein